MTNQPTPSTSAARDPFARLRLIETWLPLAQETNMHYAWGYDAAGLEALIVGAAPDLARVSSLFEARIVLLHAHMQRHVLRM